MPPLAPFAPAVALVADDVAATSHEQFYPRSAKVTETKLCSFCGADVHTAKVLIEGRDGRICNVCIAECLVILIEKMNEREETPPLYIRLARKAGDFKLFRKLLKARA
jgi:hypothetical protein